jgi:A/G-specific adenine glycosylase
LAYGQSDLSLSEAQRAGRQAAFITEVWEHYRRNGRDLPWRHTHDPYEILVSEIMLQQTQVRRVLTKYPEFLAVFPTVAALATASLGDVLAEWRGLGYNRRALSLHQTAKLIVTDYGGLVPACPEKLRRLPGIGRATAAAVSAFAFDLPHPFIETNIRAAFIHYFFHGCSAVSDADILPLVEATIDRLHPREWFYALMDYGAWVKKEYQNPSRRSRHHSVQSPLTGSRRELRSQVLQQLLSVAPSCVGADQLQRALEPYGRRPAEILSVLDDLTREGFLRRQGDAYRIA